jgi:mannitol operon repressor
MEDWMADVEKTIASAVGHTRPLEETLPHLKSFVEFLDEFNKESARGAALAAAAFLDDLLRDIINAFLLSNDSRRKLTDGFNAPLGTLSARIAACHALGLISDQEARECKLIRKVRNEFAHKLKMSFDDEKVRGLCSTLGMSAKPYPGVDVDKRGQFTTAAVALILNLTNRAHYVGQQALKYQNWKR